MCRKILIATSCGKDTANLFEQKLKIDFEGESGKPVVALSFLHGVTPPHIIWQKVKDKKHGALVFSEGWIPEKILTTVSAVNKNCTRLPQYFHMIPGVEIEGVTFAPNHAAIKEKLRLN